MITSLQKLAQGKLIMEFGWGASKVSNRSSGKVLPLQPLMIDLEEPQLPLLPLFLTELIHKVPPGEGVFRWGWMVDCPVLIVTFCWIWEYGEDNAVTVLTDPTDQLEWQEKLLQLYLLYTRC